MKKHNLPIVIALSLTLIATAVLPTMAQEIANEETDLLKIQTIEIDQDSFDESDTEVAPNIQEAELPVLENAVTTDREGSVELVDESLLDFIIPTRINGTDVLAIGEYAFNGCDLFRTVTIPAQISEIGDYAFADCPYLETIILEGRADFTDMILGENWSGDAEILFEYIVIEEETKIVQEGSGEAATGEQQPTDDVSANNDNAATDPMTDSEAPSEDPEPSEEVTTENPVPENPHEVSEPTAANEEADTDVSADASAEDDTTPASEGEGTSEAE